MKINPKIKTLIIGALIGAILTFGTTILIKSLETAKEKESATRLLKIELRRIETYLYSNANTQRNLGLVIPTTDIPELNMSIQVQQLKYFDNDLLEKVYELAANLSSANKHRETASALMNQKSDPKFKASANIFIMELDESRKILSELKNIIQF